MYFCCVSFLIKKSVKFALSIDFIGFFGLFYIYSFSLFCCTPFLTLNKEHVQYLTWKHTSPGNSTSTLMVTHDIDSSSGMNMMSLFSNSEKRNRYYYQLQHYCSLFFLMLLILIFTTTELLKLQL